MFLHCRSSVIEIIIPKGNGYRYGWHDLNLSFLEPANLDDRLRVVLL